MAQNHTSLFLRLIILEKTILGFLALILSAGLLSLINRDMEDFGLHVAKVLNLDVDNRVLMLVMDYLTNAKASTLVGISVVGFLYAGLNLIEAYGLARRYRWAEYLTVIATGMFIPFEIHEVIEQLTPLRVSALVINVLIVGFLAKHKEMFPKRLFRTS
jgi:uncharacterized membrane protein (DUF2068 family)